MPPAASTSFATDRSASGWNRLASIAGGIVVSGLILLGISQAQKTSLTDTPPPLEELRAVAFDAPPPPPPPPQQSLAEVAPPEAPSFDPIPTEGGIVIATAVPSPNPPVPRVPEITFEFDLDKIRPSADRTTARGTAHFQVEEVDRRPTVLYRTTPKVHSTSVRHLPNPTVTLIFIVSATGIAEDIRVVEAPTRDLGEIMVEAVREWKFRPAMKDGVRVSCLVQQKLFLVAQAPGPF